MEGDGQGRPSPVFLKSFGALSNLLLSNSLNSLLSLDDNQRQGHVSPLPPPSGSSESLSLPRGVRHQPGHPKKSLPHEPGFSPEAGFSFWEPNEK